MKRFGLMVLTVFVGPATAAGAEFGEAERGGELARTWCVNCHVVEAAPEAADAAQVPTFQALAAREDLTPERFQAVFVSPHPGMVGIEPSRQQIADLYAYVRSLKGK